MNILGEIVFDLSKIDAAAFTIAIVGYTIVFVALLGLYYSFKFIPHLLNYITKMGTKRKRDQPELEPAQDSSISVEVGAAISTALYLYFNEMHDDEKTVLTIEKISKRYSPWSSKIYSVTKGLNQRF